MNTVFALAGVVIKELYRRKDFYVLFVLTALMTLIMGSVNFFHDENRALFEGHLPVSDLGFRPGDRHRDYRPADSRRARESHDISAAGQAGDARQVVLGKFIGCWLACGLALSFSICSSGLWSAASREHYWPVLNYLQACGCNG